MRKKSKTQIVDELFKHISKHYPKLSILDTFEVLALLTKRVAKEYRSFFK